MNTFLLLLLLISVTSNSDGSCIFNIMACVEKSHKVKKADFSIILGFVLDYYKKARELMNTEKEIYFTLIIFHKILFVEIKNETDIGKIEVSIQSIINNVGKYFEDQGQSRQTNCLNHAKEIKSSNDLPTVMLLVPYGVDSSFGHNIIDFAPKIALLNKMTTDYKFIFQAAGYSQYALHEMKFLTGEDSDNYIKFENSAEMVNKAFILINSICDSIRLCKKNPGFRNTVNSESCIRKSANVACEITCTEDYFKVKDPVCQGRNVWDTYEPCEIKRCRSDPTINSNTNTVGTCAGKLIREQCQVVCEDGFAMAGNSNIYRCIDKDKWEGNANCYTCTNGPVGQFSIHDDCRNKSENFECEVTCNPNYKKEYENKNPVCKTENKWENENLCVQTCTEEPNVVNANFTGEKSCKSTLTGKSCAVECKDNYSPNDISFENILCKGVDGWESVRLECIHDTCTSNPTENWDVNFTQSCKGTLVGHICNPSCRHKDYAVVGNLYNCTTKNTWAGDAICILNNCNDILPVSKDINVTNCVNKSLNESCNMECKVRYETDNEQITQSQCVLEKCSESTSKYKRVWKNVPNCPPLFEEKTWIARNHVFLMVGLTSLVSLCSLAYLSYTEYRNRNLVAFIIADLSPDDLFNQTVDNIDPEIRVF